MDRIRHLESQIVELAVGLVNAQLDVPQLAAKAANIRAWAADLLKASYERELRRRKVRARRNKRKAPVLRVVAGGKAS